MTLLTDLIATELAVPVNPRVSDMAAAIAAQYPGSARAVLFYGSCLRLSELDGMMLDFYLIVSDYDAAYPKSWLAWANRLIPPNVFPFAHDRLTAKYAVLSEADLHKLCGPDASTVSVWARFAQPSRLVWSADDGAREKTIAAVSRAPVTLLSFTPDHADMYPVERWRSGFTYTYSAELRAERGDRPGSIVDHDVPRYQQFTTAIGPVPALPNLDRRWRKLRRNGKILTILRLAKASLTFAGGIDYLAWKINRHAGAKIIIKPWQRRFPIFGALILLPRLLFRGAVR